MQPRQVFRSYPAQGIHDGIRYRFCPVCSTPLSAGGVDERGNRRCGACGFVDYKNPLPGVVVLILSGDRVLLGRRGPQSFQAGLWCLPGGFIEFAEDFLSAAIREVEEETGLRVEIRSILSVVSNFLSRSLHTLVVVLRAEVAGGELRPGDDLVELRWFPLEGPLPPMAFQADAHIIGRYGRTRLEGAPVDPEYAAPPAPPGAPPR